jgi:hypothetical protein
MAISRCDRTAHLRRGRLLPCLLLGQGLLLGLGLCGAEEGGSDVVVYGGTSAGVMAAVQVARQGRSVVLIEPSRHLGGLTSGGLGATDIGVKEAIGGIAREFYVQVRSAYQDPALWRFGTFADYAGGAGKGRVDHEALFAFEPHVAERVLGDMLRAAKVVAVLGERLDLAHGVEKSGRAITALRMESGRVFAGRMFIDASYEGDLLPGAGVAWTSGREANATYGETLNGVQRAHATSHQFAVPVDPYLVPGDAGSGLLPSIEAHPPEADGSADDKLQAFNLRLCLTRESENRVPFAKPDGYQERTYELMLRWFEAGYKELPLNIVVMPNHKTDANNNNAFSSDAIGLNRTYLQAGWAERERIAQEHQRYTAGLMWTLANHARVPAAVREHAAALGWAGDEFADNGHLPYALYVREGRRMVGAYVMCEQDCVGKRHPEDPVALGSYTMDSHNVQRYVDGNGHVRNEGDVQVKVPAPYGISYRALIPKAGECSNLLVPVALSASHIAYGSIRMEPVYMGLAQAAASAACLALAGATSVQEVPYAALRERLLADHQRLAWPLAAAAGAAPR